MIVTDDLHALIQRMSQTEKAYFKKFTSLHTLGKQNNYLLLFDAIARQKEYDEEALLEAFKGEAFTRQFSVAKNYLYKLIMRSLRQYHRGMNKQVEAREMLHDAAILFDKGLYDQCARVVRRCKKLVDKYEMHALQVDVLIRELNLYMIQKAQDKKMIDRINDSYLERTAIMEKAMNLQTYDQLEYNLSFIFRESSPGKRAEVLEKAANLLKHELLEDEQKALSTTARLKYHHIYATYYFFTRQFELCLEQLLQELEWMETHPVLLERRLQDYLLLNDNAMLIAMDLQDWQAFETRVTKQKNLLETDKRITSRMWTQAGGSFYITLMQYHLRKQQYEAVQSTAEELQQQMTVHQASLSLADRFSFNNMLSHAAFYQGDYEQALDHNLALLNDAEAPKKYPQYAFARLFNLVVHFELGHLELLNSLLTSAYRERQKHDKGDKLARLLVKYLRKLLRAPDKTAKAKQFKALHEKLEALQSDPGVAEALLYFDYLGWVESNFT